MKTALKKFFIRCDGRDNTKKLCNFIFTVVPYKTVVGYIDVKQQERYHNFQETTRNVQETYQQQQKTYKHFPLFYSIYSNMGQIIILDVKKKNSYYITLNSYISNVHTKLKFTSSLFPLTLIQNNYCSTSL